MFSEPMHKMKIRRKSNKPSVIRKDISSPFDDDDDNVNSTDMDILNQLISMSSNSSAKEKNKKKDKKPKKKTKKDKGSSRRDRNMFELFDESFNGEGDSITDTSKKAREDEDFYEDRFKGSLLLLKGLMQEVNETTVDSKEHIKSMKKSPSVRGSSMAIANQSGTVSTLLNTKLSIIKEITSVNKSISDLELKSLVQKNKVKTDEDKGKDSSAYLDDMFERIMNNDIPIPEADDYKMPKSSLSKDGLDARLDTLMGSGEIEFTDSENAFRYESNGGVEIAILYDTESKNKKWEFVALNQDGEELADYPLPSKKSCGRMEFDVANDMAKDKLANVYRLIYTSREYDSYDD